MVVVGVSFVGMYVSRMEGRVYVPEVKRGLGLRLDRGNTAVACC